LLAWFQLFESSALPNADIEEVAMPRSACPLLNDLAKLLREKYNVRDKIICRGCGGIDLLNAEHDLIAVQKSITLHRRWCPHCKPPKRISTVFLTRRIPLADEAPVYPIHIAN
jgi:hypothetical protein